MTHCQLWKYRLLPGDMHRLLGQLQCLKTSTHQPEAQLERRGGAPVLFQSLVFLLVLSELVGKDAGMFYAV